MWNVVQSVARSVNLIRPTSRRKTMAYEHDYCVLGKIGHANGYVNYWGTLDGTKCYILRKARKLTEKEFWRSSWCIIRNYDDSVICTIVPLPNEGNKLILAFHFLDETKCYILCKDYRRMVIGTSSHKGS